nr:hypothetical protein [Tanacetum cinerariifolium]
DSRKTNKRVTFSTRVILSTSVSRPQLKSNPMKDRALRNNSRGKKQEVEDHRRNVKLPKNKTSVTVCNDSLNAKTLNVKFVSMCDKCVLNDKHDMCVLKYVAKPINRTVASEPNKKPRNFTRKIYEHVSKTSSWWYPKFTKSGYIWKPKSRTENVNPNLVEIFLFIVDSGCSKHMKGNLKLLINFVEKFLGTVKFGNNQIAPILGYGDLVQGAITIKRVYYVEGLNHNLFFVGQFCDVDLEVAFRKSTCFIRDLKGNDLLSGSRGTDLYSITLQDTNSPNPICLVAKATSSQAWLWHRRLDHLCSSCELGKAKRNSFHTKLTPSSKRRLQLLHMDLCGPIRVASINGKRYVLVIVDDYSRYTWTHFLRSKDETPEVLIDFLRLVQRGLQAQAEVSKAYRVFNKRTRVIMESIHVKFDELPLMASDQNSSDLAPECQTMASDQNSSDPAPVCQTIALNHDSLSPAIQRQGKVTQADRTLTTSNELDLLFKTYAENDQVADDEFINIFSNPVQDQGETSTRHVDSSNMHTFYQRYPSEHRWTKDHPIEQVIGNPSQLVRTRRQLESDAEMYMFVLTVSRTEPKNIKEAMADSTWIESMQEELYQFDRLDVWELVDRPLCTNVINLKWL